MKKSSWKILFSTYPHTRGRAPSLILLGVLLVIGLSIEPFFYKWIIDAFEDRLSWGSFAMIVVAWVVVSSATIWIRYRYSLSLLSGANADWFVFTRRIIHHYQYLPLEYHRNVQHGEKQNVMNRSTEFVWQFIDSFVLEILPQALVIIILLVSGFMMAPLLMTILVGFLPLYFFAVWKAGTTAHTKQKKINHYWDRLYDRISDSLVNLTVIRVFARQRYELSIIDAQGAQASEAQNDVRRFWVIFNSFGKLFTLVIRAIALVVSVILLKKGLIDLGVLFFFVSLADKIFSPVMMICDKLGMLYQLSAHFDKAVEVLDLEIEKDKGTHTAILMKSGLELNNVSFAYPSNPDKKVLDHVSFDLKKGSHIAIVGHTGSGKSTITQLLLRFYDGYDGQILLDGHPIDEYTLESYRGLFGAVFQDTTLFNDTIRHNLSYVRDGIRDEDIERACHEANLDDFLSRLPDGLDTVVGERGLKLSGGERQRLSIARAILADPQILLLDEATSALDTKTERLVQEAFDRLMKGRTTVVIAHRLSTIVHADQILLMDHGRIIAYGTHDELYELSEVYREMVDMQHDGFLRDDTDEQK